MGYSESSCEELVRLCATTGCAEAWEEFVRRFNRLITAVVYRTARHWTYPTQDLVQDLVQEVYLKLCDNHCQRLAGFRSGAPDAFFGFLKVVTSNLVRDHFKTAGARKRGSDLTTAISEDDPPAPKRSSGSVESLERQVLLAQIDNWLIEAGVGNNARVVFWLYYREGLTMSAIASLPNVGLSVKGVESALFRMTQQARNKLGS